MLRLGTWGRRRRQQQHYRDVLESIPLETEDELREHLCLETDPQTRLALHLALSERLSAHDAYEHLTGRHRARWTGVRAQRVDGSDSGPDTAAPTE